MAEPWRWPWLAALAIIGLSVIAELVTGTARLRGVGTWRRDQQPRAYWSVVLGKVGLGLLAVAFLALR